MFILKFFRLSGGGNPFAKEIDIIEKEWCKIKLVLEVGS